MNERPTTAEHSASNYPERIVCLTEETTEVLYLLGEEHRIAGISGYTMRPPEARLKPKVGAFTTVKYDRIMELAPDLVIGFSNLQAEIARELITRGVNVLVFNQRSVREILQMILTLARVAGVESKGLALVAQLQAELDAIAEAGRRFELRPRVFFEEWHDPLISGIRWVEELIEIAGGQPIFPELRAHQDAKRRIVSSDDVVRRDPQVLIASWCGRKVNKQQIRERTGWDAVSAVRDGNIFELKSTYILQPGPAALTEGVRQLHTILAHVASVAVPEELRPMERLDPDMTRESAQ